MGLLCGMVIGDGVGDGDPTHLGPAVCQAGALALHSH